MLKQQFPAAEMVEIKYLQPSREGPWRARDTPTHTFLLLILEAGKGRIKNGRQESHLPAAPALMDA